MKQGVTSEVVWTNNQSSLEAASLPEKTRILLKTIKLNCSTLILVDNVIGPKPYTCPDSPFACKADQPAGEH